MKRNYFRWLLVSFGAAALAFAASAGEPDRLFVNIPYEFVVSGKTLPAGSYHVERLSNNDLRFLAIRSDADRTTVFALSNEVDNVYGQRPGVTFLKTGDQRFLTKIQTGEHVFTFSAPAGNSQRTYLTGTTEK